MRTALPDVAKYPPARFRHDDWRAILGPLVKKRALISRSRYRALRSAVKDAVETLIAGRYFAEQDLAFRERRGSRKAGGEVRTDPLGLLAVLRDMDALSARVNALVATKADAREILGLYDTVPSPAPFGTLWRLWTRLDYHRKKLRRFLDDTPSGTPQATYAGFVRRLGAAFEAATALSLASQDGIELFIPFVRAIDERLPRMAMRPGVNDNYFASKSEEAWVAAIRRALTTS